MERKEHIRYTKWIFWGFGIILLVAHGFAVTGIYDDAWFAEVLNEYKLMDYLEYRYQIWTSRLPIEAVLVYLTRLNPWIWKICNVLIILLLVYECCVIWGKVCDVFTISVFILLVLLVPINMLCSAGWMATTINYLWPITVGLYSLIPICKWFRKQKIHLYEYFFGCIACLFGGSMEQMVAVLFVVYVLLICYSVYMGEKIPILLWIYSILSLAMLVFVLTCPGNASRVVMETQTWFPEFATMSLFEKLATGFLTTFSCYISCREGIVIFLLFTYVLMLVTFCIDKRKIVRCIALYPFVITFLWGFVGRIIVKMNFTTRIYWIGLLQNDKISKLGVYHLPHIIIESVVFLSVLCTVVFSLYVVFGKHIDFLISVIVILASICSSVVIGLSPTVYVSGTRTFTLGYIGFLIAVFMCVQKSFAVWQNKKIIKYMIPFYVFCFVANIVMNINV